MIILRLISLFDSACFNLVESVSCPFLDFMMVFFTKLGDAGVLWIAASVIMLFIKRYRKIGVLSLVSLVVCFLLGTYGIKPLVGRVRPYEGIEGLRLIVPPLSDFSFPSMHTATAFSCAVVFCKGGKWLGVSAVAISAIIGVSRVYLHMHYASDVIAGAVFGTLIAFVVMWFSKLISRKRLILE